MSFGVEHHDNSMETISKQQDAYLFLMQQQQQQQQQPYDMFQSLDMLQWTQQYPTPPSSACLVCIDDLYLPMLPPPTQSILPPPSHFSLQPYIYMPPPSPSLFTPEEIAFPPAMTSTALPPLLPPPTTTTPTLANAEECAALACFIWFESPKAIASALHASPSPSSSSSSLRRRRRLRRLLPTTPSKLNHTTPTAEFISFCRTLITSTRTTHDITLLSLLYIHRARQRHPHTRRKPGSEWRQLVAAFMLANKYLDDNTYTNKTWADLTGYDVSTIHAIERRLLTSLSWNLHVSHDQFKDWHNCILRLRA